MNHFTKVLLLAAAWAGTTAAAEKELATLKGYADRVKSVAFNPDGKTSAVRTIRSSCTTRRPARNEPC